jgi:uncharacterized membrane-anchored protein
VRVRWERHTELVTYTFSQSGPFSDPFANSALPDLFKDWLRGLPGQVISAALLAMEPCASRERDNAELAALFGTNTVIGSRVVGGAAQAWTDFKIHPDGFVHVLVRDCSMSESQAGRLAKRLLDVNMYRTLAMLGFPLARAVSPALSEADRRLAHVASRMTAGGTAAATSADPGFESELLAELTSLAAEIESIAAQTTYRFDASRAYYAVARQRLDQLRQQRIEGLQTFSEFLDARLAPAVATCEATAARQSDLGERAARLTSLLRARVEVSLQEQNRRLLQSMDRRAQLQLRLQETVEGLSVIAIGYYGVGLVGYALKGLEKSGLPVDATVAMAVALPFVLGIAWLGLRRVKKRLAGAS